MMIHTKKHRDEDCSDASFDAPTKDERAAAAAEESIDVEAAAASPAPQPKTDTAATR